MNWLAHIFLAEPTTESQLGNLLGDLVKGAARAQLNLNLQHGIACHTAIDRFTDSHPIVSASKLRISRSQRRCAGIIIDVLYDHLLTKSWEAYSQISLDNFVTDVYLRFGNYAAMPQLVATTIDRLIRSDLLRSYRELTGVEAALRRISHWNWRCPILLPIMMR